MYFDRSTTRLSVSPTDLANFLACRHKTALDLLSAKGLLRKPTWVDPLAAVLRDRGDAHEQAHVQRLQSRGLSVVNLKNVERDDAEVQALAAMRAGADVIVQAPLRANGWFGVADILQKVEKPSTFGAWSYEAHDTKLSRETRGGTILQLCSYSELLGTFQGVTPEHFHVITPVGAEHFRVDDFSAFYRQVKGRFAESTLAGVTVEPPAAPDSVEHCGVCRWFAHCNKTRRDVDHLSFVAGLGRQHQLELQTRDVRTLAALAALPLPLAFKPRRGAVETYERLRNQAHLQSESREAGKALYELLPVDVDFGLTQLPEPRPGDLFLDLEGDPFAESLIGQAGAGQGAGGREYLFGLGRVVADGSFSYSARWALTAADERLAFEAVMDEIMAALEADPAIHVYHYAAYEPATFKRLMGRYATREADVDRLLRGGRFVDLYAIVRHALRAGVEHYSIKDLEPLYAFERSIDLRHAGDQRRIVELALETNDVSAITPELRAEVEKYNLDDCRSTLELRTWLEILRQEQIARGTDILRPPLDPVEAKEEITERQRRIEALRAELLARAGTDRESADILNVLAYLLDWHYREDKVAWWEYFRLVRLDDDELLDERAAVAGLEFVERVEEVRHKVTGKPTGSVVDRYRYPPQEIEIRPGAKLKLRDESSFGEVIAANRVARTLDVKKGPAAANNAHPASAFTHDRVSPDVPASAVFRFGEDVAAQGCEGASNRAAVDLLLRRAPRFAAGSESLTPASGESATQLAVRVIGGLHESALPIQGPPGSGKTFTGARMICELVRQGKRIGVTGPSHKVIRNLLDAIAEAAGNLRISVRLGQRLNEDKGAAPESSSSIAVFGKNDEALRAVAHHSIDVLGGTTWLWADEDATRSVDVLFVDEAGQMSLANTIAASQAGSSLVLLGDPQQLEQPQKGSHPPGVDVSALDHILEGHQTMPAGRGLFLPVTWRLAPDVCRFTSEMFYESKLVSKPGLAHQRLAGTRRLDGAGLFLVEAIHDGCRNSSDVEVEIVADLVGELMAAGSSWIDQHDNSHPITTDDILIVAPYNAHVARLQERLPDCRVGTVDKFQGQEAPVVIYSMATSRPEDAPRGMEFLYSVNRLNVATSRARCACVLVASPHLFEPDCRTPQQMRLANALARYRELARPVS